MEDKARTYPLPEPFEKETRWMFLDERGATQGPYKAREILKLIDEEVVTERTTLTEVESQKASKLEQIRPFAQYFKHKGSNVVPLDLEQDEDPSEIVEIRKLRSKKEFLAIGAVVVVALAFVVAMAMGIGPFAPDATVQHQPGAETLKPKADEPEKPVAKKETALLKETPTERSEVPPLVAVDEEKKETVEGEKTKTDAELKEEERAKGIRGVEPKTEEGGLRRFDVYVDTNSPTNHFAPTGFMGDPDTMSVDLQDMTQPYSGGTAIRLEVTPWKPKPKPEMVGDVLSGDVITGDIQEEEPYEPVHWSGLFWQNPADNWGDINGGYDLGKFNTLIFYARGLTGDEVLSSVKIGGIGQGEQAPFADSAEKEAGPIQLSTEWQRFSVNLSRMDLSYISGGFCLVFEEKDNPEGAVVFVDEIYFTYDPGAEPSARQTEFPFYVYKDHAWYMNRFFPSGTMGDGNGITMNTEQVDNPQNGESCVEFTYKPTEKPEERWFGVYWQHPEGNWGAIDGGYDLSEATRLTFWVRGAKGGERIEEFKLGGLTGKYPDSDVAGIGPIVLEKEWKQYVIELRGRDLSNVSGGFCWAASVDEVPAEGMTFYLDEIRYEK